MLDPIPLQRAQVVRVAQLGPQLFEDGPVPLLPLASDLALEVALEIGRDVIVVDQRVVHVDQEDDPMARGHSTATAAAASTTGNDHDQSPSHETAAAPATQPAKKPMTSVEVFLRRSSAPSVSGRARDTVSSSDRTVLVKLPVITAVDGAPGRA